MVLNVKVKMNLLIGYSYGFKIEDCESHIIQKGYEAWVEEDLEG